MTSNTGTNQTIDAGQPPVAPAREGAVSQLLSLLRADRLVQAGLVVLLATAALVIFVLLSEWPLEHPLAGLFLYSLLPLFFVVGAVIFIITILRH